MFDIFSLNSGVKVSQNCFEEHSGKIFEAERCCSIKFLFNFKRIVTVSNVLGMTFVSRKFGVFLKKGLKV